MILKFLAERAHNRIDSIALVVLYATADSSILIAVAWWVGLTFLSALAEVCYERAMRTT